MEEGTTVDTTSVPEEPAMHRTNEATQSRPFRLHNNPTPAPEEEEVHQEPTHNRRLAVGIAETSLLTGGYVSSNADLRGSHLGQEGNSDRFPGKRSEIRFRCHNPKGAP